MNKITISAADNTLFNAWVLDHEAPAATIQILHGMAEHCLRYESFAYALNRAGYRVVMHNHRGHGGRQPQGHYGDRQQSGMSGCGGGCMGGWALLLDDITRVQDAVKGDEPLIMFGHSMGSFIAQSYAMRNPQRLSALVLSGSNSQPGFLVRGGKLVASTLRLFQGERHQSGVMDFLSFGEFNRHFKPNRTDFDWLSRDKEQVDLYINDPHCGHPCSLQLWSDLMDGLTEIARPENLRKIPADMPIYIFGGSQDPVGMMGKGLPRLENQYIQTGHDKVTMRLYAGGRHEMLNEINRQQVISDVIQWLKEVVWKQSPTAPSMKSSSVYVASGCIR